MTAAWDGRRVLVTGATGIVGSWLVKALVAQGAAVVALVRNPNPQSEFYRSGIWRRVTIVQGQLEDYWALERAISAHAVDAVFHLAAQPIVSVARRSPLPTFEANIRGTYNLLEACRAHRALVQRIVVASSDKAYGEAARLPYTEEMPLAGRAPYDVSKTCADLIAQSYHRSYGLPIGIARCGNIFGGGDLNWSRIVPDTVRACLNGARPIIRSDGTYVRDYIYVQDVAEAYLHLGAALDDARFHGEAFNFSLERAVTVLELVARIQRIMGCEHLTPDVRGTATGEIREQFLDATRARTQLGWRPRYTLDDGLRETIDWYRAYLDEAATGAAHAATGAP